MACGGCLSRSRSRSSRRFQPKPVLGAGISAARAGYRPRPRGFPACRRWESGSIGTISFLQRFFRRDSRAGGACAPSALSHSEAEGRNGTSLREQCFNHVWRLPAPSLRTQTGSFPKYLWSRAEVDSSVGFFPLLALLVYRSSAFKESASTGREGEAHLAEAAIKGCAASCTGIFPARAAGL